jgi:hypothetical protein
MFWGPKCGSKKGVLNGGPERGFQMGVPNGGSNLQEVWPGPGDSGASNEVV